MIIKFDDSNLEGTDLKVCTHCGNKMLKRFNYCNICTRFLDGTNAFYSDPDEEAKRIEAHNKKYGKNWNES